MADRILTWHVTGVLSETDVVRTSYGEEYTLDKNYSPERLILRLKEAGDDAGDPCIVDINVRENWNDTPESILETVKAAIDGVQKEAIYYAFATRLLKEGSIITLDIDQVNVSTPGKDLTVQLDLVEAI